MFQGFSSQVVLKDQVDFDLLYIRIFSFHFLITHIFLRGCTCCRLRLIHFQDVKLFVKVKFPKQFHEGYMFD